MSLRFPPKAALAVLCLVLSAGVAFARKPVESKHATAVSNPPPAADDSSRSAHEMLLFLRAVYGTIDNWNFIEGWRYYATFRIPGPDSTQVSEWTEAHMHATVGRLLGLFYQSTGGFKPAPQDSVYRP